MPSLNGLQIAEGDEAKAQFRQWHYDTQIEDRAAALPAHIHESYLKKNE